MSLARAARGASFTEVSFSELVRIERERFRRPGDGGFHRQTRRAVFFHALDAEEQNRVFAAMGVSGVAVLPGFFVRVCRSIRSAR